MRGASPGHRDAHGSAHDREVERRALTAALEAFRASGERAREDVEGRVCAVFGWEATPPGVALIGTLARAWLMNPADFVHADGFGERRSLPQVAAWASARCETRPAEEVARDLLRFREAPEVERLRYALLPHVGLATEPASFDFGDGSRLATIATHPDRRLARELAEANFWFAMREPVSLFLGVVERDACRFGGDPAAETAPDGDARLEDLVMCLNLCRPIDEGLGILALSEHHPDDSPLHHLGYSWRGGFPRRPGTAVPIEASTLREAETLRRQLLACEAPVRARIRLAARYLTRWSAAGALEDRAIALRVALETTFNHPGGRSIRATVAESAGRLLGRSAVEREAIRVLMVRVYTTTSEVVHEGRAGPGFRIDEARAAGEHVRTALRRMAREGRDLDQGAL